MKVKMLGAHLAVALSIVSGSAYADQMIISYSSGKTQTITLDEPIEQVKDMRLDRNADSLFGKVKGLLTGKPGSEEQGAKKEQPATKNSLPRIEWAPPVSE
ncbi:hypothetical protein [Citrifermentans bremense]|uniref:hypothetical protein n=1 Tax=Citrifermentans bremense TaxID=60035 RepID=UPI0004299148|nr:hypothetical protein [Citrifermentans bremense]